MQLCTKLLYFEKLFQPFVLLYKGCLLCGTNHILNMHFFLSIDLNLGILQEAESKAKNMEEEICRLQRSLEERSGQLQASASTAEKVPPFPCSPYKHTLFINKHKSFFIVIDFYITHNGSFEVKSSHYN